MNNSIHNTAYEFNAEQAEPDYEGYDLGYEDEEELEDEQDGDPSLADESNYE